jgi:hypothetical protein
MRWGAAIIFAIFATVGFLAWGWLLGLGDEPAFAAGAVFTAVLSGHWLARPTD